MADDLLLVDVADGVATVTLNRPAAMNALSRALRAAIVTTFRRLADDAAVEVLILTGAGRAFCAGLDLKELGGESGAADDTESAVAGADVVAAVQTCGKPVIGAINGFAITGGFELALACDVLIAAHGARFADTHARVGILPGWGLSQKLSRTIGIYRAKELSLTGNYLSAEQAESWGLVNRVVAPEALLPTCRAARRRHALMRPRRHARLQARHRRRLRRDLRPRPRHRDRDVARPRARSHAGGPGGPPRRRAVARDEISRRAEANHGLHGFRGIRGWRRRRSCAPWDASTDRYA